jgi:hypothetical protein
MSRLAFVVGYRNSGVVPPLPVPRRERDAARPDDTEGCDNRTLTALEPFGIGRYTSAPFGN